MRIGRIPWAIQRGQYKLAWLMLKSFLTWLVWPRCRRCGCWHNSRRKFCYECQWENVERFLHEEEPKAAQP